MTAQATVKIGSTLGGRFELLEEIGAGGFGTIYLARQLNVDRLVALKILPPEFVAVESVVERFRREARLASRLRHPNSITIHDYGQEGNYFFISMEYLQGEDLGDRLRREKTLPLDLALHVARQALMSLKEAHSLGIVHRDLKPENIFLTSLGDDQNFVKILDFGIATLAESGLLSGSESGRQLTVQGSTVGTPAYMSPEQAAGDSVGPGSDLYSLGIILYEMVNGKVPFRDPSPIKVMRSQLFDPLPVFANKALRNTRFESIVRKALEKDPAHRFASAAEFLEALEQDGLENRAVGFVQLEQMSPTSEEPTPETKPNAPADEIPFQSLPAAQEEPPPAGFKKSSGSITSSIITVLEEPAPEDVIVLTELKESPPAKPKKEEWGWNEDLAIPDASGSQILTNPLPRRRPLLLLGVVAVAVALILFLLFTAL